VLQSRDGSGLTLEPIAQLRRQGQPFRQYLDRDVPPEPSVPRSVNLAHTPGPDRREDLVRAQPRAGGKRHLRARAASQFVTSTTCDGSAFPI